MEKELKNELGKFLKLAKSKTFASLISIPKFNLDGSKEYSYKKGDWLYKDKYYGSVVDTGNERVFYKNKLIWSMAYRGGMFESKKDLSKKCFSFLKKCLLNIPSEFPVRGPKIFNENNLIYENIWKGNLEDFIGEEKIFLGEEQIYFRNYIGGTGEPRI